MSVLTDRSFFQGSLDDLRSARSAVTIPVLRKDFTIGEFHVIEAAAAGADAILLIAAILTTAEMKDFRELAAQFKMDALVEVHDAEELASALDSGAEILGVNNRDLRTFEISIETTFRLLPRIPDGPVVVSESGVMERSHVQRLEEAGVDALLVGEALMRSGDPVARLRELRGVA